MKRLELRLEARAEFLEAIRHYEAQRVGLGARFKAEVDRTLTRVATAPPAVSPDRARIQTRRRP